MAAYPADRWVWRLAREQRLTATSLELRAWVFFQSSLVCSLGPMLWFTGGEAGKILAAFYVSAGLLNALTTFKGNGPLLLIGVFTPLLQMTLLPIAAFAFAGEARTLDMIYPLLGPVVFGAFCVSIWKGLAEGEESRIAEHSAAIANLERAEEEGDARAHLFQMVERELRAPLQALSAAARRVSAAALPAEVRSQARTLEDAAAVMATVLTDLQALSTLQAGGLRITPVATDPAALVNALADAWRPVARDKWLEVFVDIGPSVPANVAVDAVRISQVVHHLLANAVRFTRQGGVRLRLEASALEGTEVLLAFTVTDTGPGMTAERLTDLLAPGDRLGRAASRGYGLSLALCAEVAEAMGGRLKAWSVEGQGSVFSLVAPVRVLAPEDTLAAPAAATAAEALSRKVLIVDDSAATRRLAKVFLQEAGHRAITASSGSQALQALRQEHFDAIITDLRMPGMDGLAFARAVRARPERYGEAPILAFSADHDQWDAPAVRAAGVQGFLTKPFTPSSLLLALEGAIAAAPETRTSAA
jgi:signal transduction histidine kinase/ActR/RegA family two-component response regulator